MNNALTPAAQALMLRNLEAAHADLWIRYNAAPGRLALARLTAVRREMARVRQGWR